MIGAGAVVEDSFIGPYTAIGAGAVVAGAEIDYSMVLADAQVRYPRYPLEASGIGAQAWLPPVPTVLIAAELVAECR